MADKCRDEIQQEAEFKHDVLSWNRDRDNTPCNDRLTKELWPS